MSRWNARFAIAVLLLSGTALFMNTRVAKCLAPQRISLGSLPMQLADWDGADIPIPAQASRLLRGATLLQRAYYKHGSTESAVNIYVAYYANQRAGDRRHLPDDCLEGSGWSTVESGTTMISMPGDPPFEANRYLITRAGERQLLLYWFWARGRNVASQDWADAYLIFDALRFKRNDDALIRINTPLSGRDDVYLAQQRLLSFAGQLSPLMHGYFPR